MLLTAPSQGPLGAADHLASEASLVTAETLGLCPRPGDDYRELWPIASTSPSVQES